MDDRKRLKNWLDEHKLAGQDCVAIFDIGTKAVRVLVAPKQPPETWDKKTFWNDAAVTNIGYDIEDTEFLDSKSKSFAKLLKFINGRKTWLQECGVTDIALIATAWFRWLTNEEEITAIIKKRTSLTVEKILHDEEAELVIASLPFIDARSVRKLRINAGDLVFVVDQGGGSLEISWMEWPTNTEQTVIQNLRIEKFGTMNLRHDFFHQTPNSDTVVPEQNHTAIKTQMEQVQRHVLEVFCEHWNANNLHTIKNKNVHLLATGSAITGSTPSLQKKNQFAQHGHRLPVARVEEKLHDLERVYLAMDEPVAALYKTMHGKKGSDIRNDIDLIGGLPVYFAAAKALAVDEIKILGYPLRYGWYVANYGNKN